MAAHLQLPPSGNLGTVRDSTSPENSKIFIARLVLLVWYLPPPLNTSPGKTALWFPIWFQNVLINSFKLCQVQASNTLTDCWSCVGSGLPMDVCNFTWQHEKRKGHKSGSKWKLVHFPLCSLPWITNAVIWAGFVAYFFHCMCDWHTFFKTTWRHPGEGTIWTSLATVWNYLTEWWIVSGLSSLKTFL